MPSRRADRFPLLLGALLCAGLVLPAQAASLSTLFTTPQERQIINSNRYKDDGPKPVVAEPEFRIELPRQDLAQEEVVREYRISGITLSQDGPHSVWINSVVYEDGAELEDGSKVRVLTTGDELRVRITAPDGRQYYATSGQALEISYLVTVQN